MSCTRANIPMHIPAGLRKALPALFLLTSGLIGAASATNMPNSMDQMHGGTNSNEYYIKQLELEKLRLENINRQMCKKNVSLFEENQELRKDNNLLQYHVEKGGLQVEHGNQAYAEVHEQVTMLKCERMALAEEFSEISEHLHATNLTIHVAEAIESFREKLTRHENSTRVCVVKPQTHLGNDYFALLLWYSRHSMDTWKNMRNVVNPGRKTFGTRTTLGQWYRKFETKEGEDDDPGLNAMLSIMALGNTSAHCGFNYRVGNKVVSFLKLQGGLMPPVIFQELSEWLIEQYQEVCKFGEGSFLTEEEHKYFKETLKMLENDLLQINDTQPPKSKPIESHPAYQKIQGDIEDYVDRLKNTLNPKIYPNGAVRVMG